MGVKTLYRSRELGTLARGDRSHRDRARAAPDSLARTVSTLLRPSRATARAADVRARRVQRQRSQVDAGDVGQQGPLIPRNPAHWWALPARKARSRARVRLSAGGGGGSRRTD